MSDPTKSVVQTDFFTVVDGLLGSEQRDRLWNYFQIQPFRRVDALNLQGDWSLEDSGVLRGPTAGWGKKFDSEYPTGTPLDDVIQVLLETTDLFATTVGRRGEDWESFSAMPTIYVAGQGLVWHRDAVDNAGSWVYYAHPEWNIEWGGELLLAHDRDIPREYGVYLHRLRPMEGLPDAPAWKSHLDNRDANEWLMERGVGSYVAPKPNRLVVIKGGTPHAIAKVRASAGRHVRVSVGGFFKKPIAQTELVGTV
jgi:2-oxoglutarate-Fe(II)-dependent oxygenase superfamily protein